MRMLPFILAALFNSIGTADPITMDRFSVDLISWPGTNPQAGTDGALAVILDIEDHWHLQAGAGTPEAKPDAIPTELEITAPEGWTIGQPVWPAAADFKIGEVCILEIIIRCSGRLHGLNINFSNKNV